MTAVLVIAACWLSLNGPAGSGSTVQSARLADAGTVGSSPTPSPTPAAASATAAPSSPASSSKPSASTTSDCGNGNTRAATRAGRMDAFTSSASVASSSGRLVFAHYMPNLPVSIDNQPADRDYYSRQYLNPTGEGGAHAAYGGLIRDRPLPRPVVHASNWREVDVRREVREASACGLNGFSVDILSTSGAQLWGQLQTMLRVTATTSRSFKIMLMPDMSALPDQGPQQLADKLATLARYSSAFRLPDGRLVVSPFLAEARSVDWWTQFIAAMRGHGVRVALVPVFVNMAAWEPYAKISYGISDWGNRNPQDNSLVPTASLAPRGLPRAVHARGKIWMQPVSVQDERPRAGIYEEAANTENLRRSWAVAITTHADWVQLTTWNDYSEGTQFAPSVKHGWSFLKISEYYQKWWRTGRPPAVRAAQLFLTYRTQPHAATPRFGQSVLMHWRPGGTPPQDRVEALTILNRPATVVLGVGGRTYKCSAPAGVHACTAPLSEGSVSATLARSGTLLATSRSAMRVSFSPKVQDLQYVAVTGRSVLS